MSGTTAETLPLSRETAVPSAGWAARRQRVEDLSEQELREWIALDASEEELNRLGDEGARCAGYL
jgi:hypothetical protein